MSAEHLPVELLSAHLDGETTPGERGRVELHLAACAACRAELEDLRRIAEASARLEVPEVPEALRGRIEAAVARPRVRRRAWIGAAASLAAVGLVATAWYLQGPPAPPEAPVAPPVAFSAPIPPPPPPPPPSAKVAQADEADAAAPAPASRPRKAEVRQRLVAKEETKADAAGGVVGGVVGGIVGPADSNAPAPMMRTSAPVPFDADAVACGVVSFVEVAVDRPLDRASLEQALRRQGARPQPETRRGVLDAIVPRERWPECRKVLDEAGIVLDEAKVEALGGICVGVSIRYPAP